MDVVRAHDSKPAYRDLELDADGKTIWAACICDKVGVNPAKALVKLDTEGNHYPSWLTQAGTGSFGQSVVDHNGKLFLAAGGSDFVAEFDKAAGGARGWKQDTSGSAQAVAVYDGQLVVGGHFYYVGDNRADKCGAGRPGDPLLNPNGECQRRQGIAAYSFGGHSTRTGIRPTPAATAWCGSCTPRGSGCTPAESSRRSAGSPRTPTRGSRRLPRRLRGLYRNALSLRKGLEMKKRIALVVGTVGLLQPRIRMVSDSG